MSLYEIHIYLSSSLIDCPCRILSQCTGIVTRLKMNIPSNPPTSPPRIPHNPKGWTTSYITYHLYGMICLSATCRWRYNSSSVVLPVRCVNTDGYRTMGTHPRRDIIFDVLEPPEAVDCSFSTSRPEPTGTILCFIRITRQ